jgi:signal transduction histidine kinase
MLPAIGLVAEALTTFICGLYTGFRWANRHTLRFLRTLPELSVVCGIAALSWLVDRSSGGVVASSMVATGLFFLAFARLHPLLLTMLVFFAVASGSSAATLSGSRAVGLLLWESLLVAPAALSLLAPRRDAPDPVWARIWEALPLLAVLLLLSELFLYRQGIRNTSAVVSVVTLVVAGLWVGTRGAPRPEAGAFSGFLALGVLHEYRGLLGRLQLLSDFGTRQGRHFEVAEGQPEPLGLISSELRLSAASLRGLDALYGRETVGKETRVPDDVEAILRLAGPVFRQSGKKLVLRMEEGIVIAAPPGVVLHCLLILLRNALDHSGSPGADLTSGVAPDRVFLTWACTRPGTEALLRIVNNVGDRSAAQPGWGRGLRIVRGLARRYGGSLSSGQNGASYSAELRFPLSKPF